MMKSRRIPSTFGLAALALLGLPWDRAEASEGTTAAGYAGMAGLVVLVVGALGVLSLGISLRRYHRSRLGREPRSDEVSRWEWFFISCVPRPSPDAHHSGGGDAGDGGA